MMSSRNRLYAAATAVLLGAMSLPAFAGTGAFARGKPHMSPAVSGQLKGMGGVGQAARHKPKGPWDRRPRLKCSKPKDSAAIVCH